MDPLKHFVRDAQGAWTCIERVELEGPAGRIQVSPGTRIVPGTVFMGVDLARWLDERAAKLQPDGDSGGQGA